jgi:hypothetical protein
MDWSPDRFLVLQLEKEGIRPKCRYPYMPSRIDFAAAYLDSLLTKSQVQMASKDVSGSFQKWADGGVGPECEPCSPRSPANSKPIVLILDPPTTTTDCPRHNRYQTSG